MISLAGLSAGTELPAGPGEEGDGYQQRDDGVGGQAVAGVPEQDKLHNQENKDGDGDEERHAAAVSIDTHTGVNLAVDVELVEPHDDEDCDKTEYDV